MIHFRFDPQFEYEFEMFRRLLTERPVLVMKDEALNCAACLFRIAIDSAIGCALCGKMVHEHCWGRRDNNACFSCRRTTEMVPMS